MRQSRWIAAAILALPFAILPGSRASADDPSIAPQPREVQSKKPEDTKPKAMAEPPVVTPDKADPVKPPDAKDEKPADTKADDRIVVWNGGTLLPKPPGAHIRYVLHV